MTTEQCPVAGLCVPQVSHLWPAQCLPLKEVPSHPNGHPAKPPVCPPRSQRSPGLNTGGVRSSFQDPWPCPHLFSCSRGSCWLLAGLCPPRGFPWLTDHSPRMLRSITPLGMRLHTSQVPQRVFVELEPGSSQKRSD